MWEVQGARRTRWSQGNKEDGSCMRGRKGGGREEPVFELGADGMSLEETGE